MAPTSLNRKRKSAPSHHGHDSKGDPDASEDSDSSELTLLERPILMSSIDMDFEAFTRTVSNLQPRKRAKKKGDTKGKKGHELSRKKQGRLSILPSLSLDILFAVSVLAAQ